MKLAVVGTGKIAHQVVSYLVEWGYEFAAIVSTPRSFAQATDLAQLTKSTAFSSFEDALPIAFDDRDVEFVAQGLDGGEDRGGLPGTGAVQR